MKFEKKPRIDITNREGLSADTLNLLSQSIQEIQQGLSFAGFPPELAGTLAPSSAVDTIVPTFLSDGTLSVTIIDGTGVSNTINIKSSSCIQGVSSPSLGVFEFQKDGRTIKIDLLEVW